MKKIFIGLTLLLCLNLFVAAEEGMWMLSQLKDLNLANKGIKLDLADIYSTDKPCITDAVVLLGGGTSEFVSDNGLLLTNHHVAFGAVQRASTKGTDFLTMGFLARTYAEEIEAPGYTAQILTDMKDVTAEFTRFEKVKDPLARSKAVELKIKQMTEKIEKGREDVNAVVAEMFNGKQYVLYVYKRFEDVRVVYVPPLSVGNYGGEIDNWMWPRHTGDFSFMRVYMAPDGSGRKFNKENVPYKPKNWLKLPSEALKKGDQTFIMGFPGRTTRYRTSHSVRENLEHDYPNNIKLFKEIIELNEGFSTDSLTAKMKTAGIIKGLNNGMKNMQGNVDGMKRTNFLQSKIDYEKELTAFLKQDETLFKKYGHVLGDIEALYKESGKYRERDSVNRFSGTIASSVGWLYRTAREREKPKKQRDPDFSEVDNKRTLDRMRFRYMGFYEPADKAMMVKALKAAADLPEGQRFKGLDYILNNKSKTIEQWVDEAYETTKFKDIAALQSMAKKTVKELEALGDPFIQAAKSMYPEQELDKKRNESFNAGITQLRKQYIDALYAWKGKGLYPDANRSIRFSLGRVDGYSPRDAVYYQPFTSIKGMLEKDSGKEPFDMPQKLKDLYAKKDFGRWAVGDDVPIAFTHKVDSTGGNSGSPVLNAKGELVGILFDGNYEAMTGDWNYDADIQRSISVDIRYVMFIVEKFAQADNILKEMGVN